MSLRKGHIFKPLLQRFEEKYIPEPNSGCWLWTGTTNGKGYGVIFLQAGTRIYAHRLSYKITKGVIPNGLQIDHLCRNSLCVNPDHLEAVTNRENTLRGEVSVLRPARSHCSHGHPLTTFMYIDTQGHRQCRECLHTRQAAYRERKKNHAAI